MLGLVNHPNDISLSRANQSEVKFPNDISLSRANQSQVKFKSAVGGNLLQSWVNLTITSFEVMPIRLNLLLNEI